MHPNFHSILSDFFIKGHNLNYIAATYESSWYEVAEVLDSDLARKYMRAANRALHLRAVGQNLRSRLNAIHTLETTITERRDSSHSSIEARRRAATAILSGTKPGRTNKPPRADAHPKSAQPSPSPKPSALKPAKQPAPRSAAPTPDSTTTAARTPLRTSPLTPARQSSTPSQALRTTSTSTSKTRPAHPRQRASPTRTRRQCRATQRPQNSS